MKVAFAHNVFDRFNTLNETVTIERNVFPESDVFIACNSHVNDIFFNQIKNSFVKYYTNTPEHKIGCVNGLMLSCNMSLEKDYDILIFSHDDVRINPNYIDVINGHISDIFTGKYDLICRNANWYGNEYAMMEVIFMNRKTVEALFSNITLLKNEDEIGYYKNTRSICPECWFYKKLNDAKINSNIIEYNTSSPNKYNEVMSNQIGYIHLNAGIRGWKD
jgi:hypothetical protein